MKSFEATANTPAVIFLSPWMPSTCLAWLDKALIVMLRRAMGGRFKEGFLAHWVSCLIADHVDHLCC